MNSKLFIAFSLRFLFSLVLVNMNFLKLGKEALAKSIQFDELDGSTLIMLGFAYHLRLIWPFRF